LCTVHYQLNHHLSHIGFHPDGLCEQCEIPETAEHVIQVCPKYTEARQHPQHALNQIGVTFHTPEILRGLFESQAYIYRFFSIRSWHYKLRCQNVPSPTSPLIIILLHVLPISVIKSSIHTRKSRCVYSGSSSIWVHYIFYKVLRVQKLSQGKLWRRFVYVY